LTPVGKPPPPLPRKPVFLISSTICCGVPHDSAFGQGLITAFGEIVFNASGSMNPQFLVAILSCFLTSMTVSFPKAPPGTYFTGMTVPSGSPLIM
jgi:hypothetical protein